MTGKKTRSYLKSTSSSNDFLSQNLLSKAENDICTFSDADIKVLVSNQKFPPATSFRDFDPSLKSDFVSPTWICFYEYHFSIGLSFPFSPLISEFFRVTGLSFVQFMPMVWRVLSWIDHINNTTNINLGLPEIASVYNLRTFGSSRFLFKIKPGKSHLVQKVAHHDIGWKGRYFFVRRTSILGGDKMPEKWITKISKFEDLCPATIDTNRKIEQCLALSLEDRTFKTVVEVPSEEEYSTSIVSIVPDTKKMSTGSKFTRSSSALVFSDVEALISGKKTTKVEGNLPPIGSKRSAGKVFTPDSKNKKLTVEEDVFDGLTDDESKKKLVLLTQAATNAMAKSNEELRKEMLSMKKELEAKLVEKANILEKKESDMAQIEENFFKENDDMAAEAKLFAAKSVLQARLMMVEDVKTGECSSWDEESCRKYLKSLTGEAEEGGESSSKIVEGKNGEDKEDKEIVEVNASGEWKIKEDTVGV